MAYPLNWACPICNTTNKDEEKCKNCTYPKLWKCVNCEKEVHDNKICAECGYNSLNPEKSKTVIKKGDIFLIAGVIYLLILGIVVALILTQDKITNVGDLLIGSPLGFNFRSFGSQEGVIFT